MTLEDSEKGSDDKLEFARHPSKARRRGTCLTSLNLSVLIQRSPTFLAPWTSFVEVVGGGDRRWSSGELRLWLVPNSHWIGTGLQPGSWRLLH